MARFSTDVYATYLYDHVAGRVKGNSVAVGIRHLFWDAGYGFELKDAYRSGWIVVGVSLVATALSWIIGLRLV